MQCRMGFVLSGMNGGNLIAPFVAGVIYEHVGYYAVWGVCLSIIAFDVVLRLGMIEKSTARKWLNPRCAAGETSPGNEEDPLLAEEAPEEIQKIKVGTQHSTASYGIARAEEPSEEAIRVEGKPMSWSMRRMPAMATLLRSPRILAAIYGCFTHTLIISSFDAVIPVFVKRTFLWSPTDVGLIFFALTIPSALGAFIGYLSDRFGTRSTALFGFGLTVPSLALLGVITGGSALDQATLIVLLVTNGRTFFFLNCILAHLNTTKSVSLLPRYWSQFYPRSSCRRHVLRGGEPRERESIHFWTERRICARIFALRCSIGCCNCCWPWLVGADL